MTKRKTLSDKGVVDLKSKDTRYAFPDPELRGHYVRVMPSGTKSFVAVAQSPHGKQVWATIGACDVLEIEEARERARSAIKRIKAGLPPFEAPPPAPNSFHEIAEQWLARHVRKKKLRSEGEITRLLKAHVYPRWGKRDFLEIRRLEVTELLDEVEDDHGARQADYVLAIVRAIMNWQATRSDDYAPPIVKGMRRTNQRETARERILDDDELRAIWTVAEDNGKFGAFIRLALLTAQRRRKVATMRWKDVKDGTWSIPTDDREKGNAGDLLLPDAALVIIQAQTKLGENPHVLPGRGRKGSRPINGFSKSKNEFDAKLKRVAPWTVHDLRRTARSLMSRAGVRSDIAERVMGHVIDGVEGVYDRHAYRDEKAEALQKLAALIEGIVHPCENVVPLQKAAS